MNNRFYTFNNTIRKQGKGGAIGNVLTERVGKMLMKRHDKKYLKLLVKLKVENELFERYVDDETECLAGFDPGVRFNGKKLVIREELVEEDKEVAEDVRTMNILKKIGNWFRYTEPCIRENKRAKSALCSDPSPALLPAASISRT